MLSAAGAMAPVRPQDCQQNDSVVQRRTVQLVLQLLASPVWLTDVKRNNLYLENVIENA